MKLARPGARSRSSLGFDEPDAVRRAQAGDQEAFAALMDRYGRAVLSLCYGSTLNAAEAEDLAQEVFFAAWRGLGHFRADSKFSTWLFALARNACVDRARRAAVRPRLAEPHEARLDAGADDDVAAQLTARAVMAAAGRLSIPLRQALLLRDIQGLAYEEIAALQGVPIGTVRSRLAAARAAVAEEVGG